MPDRDLFFHIIELRGRVTLCITSQLTRTTWKTSRLPYSILTIQCDTIGLGSWLTIELWPFKEKSLDTTLLCTHSGLCCSDMRPVTVVVEQEKEKDVAISSQSDHLSNRRSLLHGLLAV